MSIVSGLNINLVVPVFLIFLIMRTKSAFNIAMRFLSGLRFFTQQRYAAISKAPKENPTPNDILEKSIAQLNLTMIELDDTLASRYILSTQLFFDIFEVLVNLGIGALLSYLWAMGYHCAEPAVVPSCWVVLLLFAFAAFAFQSLLQIVTMTGWRARESKLAGIAGMATFLVSAILFYFHASYVNQETVVAIAQHANALLMQLSRDIKPMSLTALVPAVQVALSIFAGLLAAGLVIPAVRYSQAIEVMNFGARAALVSSSEKTLMWIDFLLPAIVAVVYSPLPLFFMRRWVPRAAQTAALVEAFGNSLMTVQLATGAVMLVVRVLCMRKHLQCFLDSVVRVVSAHLIAAGAGQVLDQSLLLPRVKACTDYLMAAATQYLAVPFFSLAVILLMHKASPSGTGLCYAAHMLAKRDPAPLLESILLATQANTTALAVETASKPYLSHVLGAIASVDMGNGAKASSYAGLSASEAVNQFATKLSGIYALPAGPAVALCKAIVCLQSSLWFVLCVGFLLAWAFQPTVLVGSATARAAAANPTAAAAAEAAAAAAAAATKADKQD